MRIQVKGRNGATVDEELLSQLGEEAREGRPPGLTGRRRGRRAERGAQRPRIRESQVAEATLQLKGTTLRASESSTDMGHSINLMADDLARQVKKHRDKRRGRREAQKAGQQPHAA